MRIVVTGTGVVSALGIGRDANLNALLHERSGITQPEILQTVHLHYPIGEVKYSNQQLSTLAKIEDQTVLPRTSLLGILAAREALAQAGLKPNADMAFISGTTVGGMDLTEQRWKDYERGLHIETIALHEAGESTNAIACRLGAFGYIATPSTACSSALNAIFMGADMIRTRMVKYALVGGSESLSLFHFNGFRSLMILDETPCRPFDASRAGLNLGEGAGYLVLETEESAIERGAEILAYIGGYANTCDAFHQTASSENGEGAYLAMKKAIEMSGLFPSDIDFVKAHGTATPNNDASESTALRRVFGNRMPPICSTKAYTGHTTSASGGVESVYCILAMNNSFVPASLNWNSSDEYTVMPNPRTHRKNIRHVLCNAFGFGGNESALVLSLEPIELSSTPIPCDSMQQAAFVNQITLDDQAEFLSSLEVIRMTLQTRRVVIAALKALRLAEITKPDAIICATQWGCMQQSMRFLLDMLQSQEQDVKPTYFMQSTHNTIAATIAIRMDCHGYNNTYSQGKQSLDCALIDIRNQMALGRIKNALVLEFDEDVEQWNQVLSHIHQSTKNIARAYVYKVKKYCKF